MTDNIEKIPDEFYRGADRWQLNHFPPIVNNRNHTVLFQLPLPDDASQPPQPRVGANKWDLNHVRMPYAAENVLKIKSSVSALTQMYLERF